MSLPATLSLSAVAAFAAYIILGNLWHRVLAPLPAPDPATFPRAGDRFVSVAEGVVQEVHRVEHGMVYGRAILAPGAAGPPMHVHHGFDEQFTPIEGSLHVQLADRVVVLAPGDTLRVPAGMPHKPFNPTTSPVILGGDGALFPQSFAATLVQLYRFMDERGTHPLTMMLQTSLLDPIADTHLAAVPRAMEPVMRAVLAPAARLLGFRNYYDAWALHPTRPALSSSAPVMTSGSR